MSKRDDFVRIMVDIANDDSHGYSQASRWPSEGPDFDCSSLVYWAANQAGYDVTIGPAGVHYTGTIIEDFTDAGFRCDDFDGNLYDLEPGDVLLSSSHVAVYVGDGLVSEASSSETGGIYGEPGDQTGWEIHVGGVYGGWQWVLTPPPEGEGGGGGGYEPSGDGRLNGIDIASWQAGIDVANVDADFVIVKVSGGTSYINPYWREWADAALASGKSLGFYHFACEYDEEPGGRAEAEFFLDQIQGYEGKAILCLDWEAHACDVSPSYAKEWLDTVASRTGAIPLFYSYSSYLDSHDLSSLTEYPLWFAAYPRMYEYGDGYVDDPEFVNPMGNWQEATIYQYSSTRHINGYGGVLDCNVFYGNKSDWNKLAGNDEEDIVTPQDKKDIAWEVLWGHWEVNGNPDWTLGGAIINMVKDTWGYDLAGVRAGDRVVGTDIAANNVNNNLPKIIDAVANPADAAAIAKDVQEAVNQSLEKIELNVHVKE